MFNRWMCAGVAILFVILCAGPAAAEDLAPGVTYSQYRDASGPWDVHVVAAERRPEYKLRVGWPGGVRNFASRAPTSAIAAQYDSSNRDVLAAVNASFFGTTPDVIGLTASDGELLEVPNGAYETAILTTDGGATIVEDVSHAAGTLRFADGSTVLLHRYNKPAVAGEIAAFSQTWGHVSVDLPPPGVSMIVLDDVTYPMHTQKEVAGVVSAVRWGNDARSLDVPAGGMLIVADAAYQAQIEDMVSVGDRLVTRFNMSTTRMNNGAMAITGIGWLLQDGVANTANWQQYTFDSVQHPRTVLAWNDTHWFLMAVDGRSTQSVGMTFAELANFLISELNATDAINLDGGGSTTMVVDGTVRNNPSDGSERAVANAVMLVKHDTRSTLPVADTFAAAGRRDDWVDKFTYNPVSALSPPAPDGDGYVINISDPAGGVETLRRGDRGDTNYAVQADIYCEYRPGDVANGFERYGLFARDSGTGAFGLSTHGGGNCYAMTYDSGDGRIRAGVIVNGTLTDLLPTPQYAATTTWRRFRIDCHETTIRYWLDGEVLYETQDSTHAAGCCGLAFHEFFSTNSAIHGTRADNFMMTRAHGDFDGDDRTDESDLLFWAFCLRGPDVPKPPGTFCSDGDLDGDFDVDLRDIRSLQRVFTGP